MYRYNVIAIGKDRAIRQRRKRLDSPPQADRGGMPPIYTHAVANNAINPFFIPIIRPIPFLATHLLIYRKSQKVEFASVLNMADTTYLMTQFTAVSLE